MIFDLEDGRLLPGADGLSEEQGRALRLDRHVVVTAGAGSGKTRTLARRYLRILGSFAGRAADLSAAASSDSAPGPDAIVVSTFTERAAAEMGERIRGELIEGLRELRARRAELSAALGPPRFEAYLHHLERCLRDFHRARIGTFHGFCAGLLKEFAAAARLDPGFGLLTGGEAKELRDVVAEEALAQLDSGRPELQPLVDGLGRRGSKVAVTSWLDKHDELRAFGESLDGEVDEVLARWLDAYGTSDPDALDAALEAARPELLVLAQATAGSAKPFVLGEAAQAALDHLASPRTGVAQGQGLRAVWAGFATQAGALRGASLTGSGALAKADKAPAKAAWTALRAQLLDAFGADGEALDGLLDAADVASVPVLQALRLLSDESAARYRELKEDAAVLDFDDLQLRLRDLLRSRPDLADSIRARFEHILVDEFQDTNALQWTLVRLLMGDPLPDSGLFLVGDPKQAIYRFRGGDVTMFDRAREQLGELEDVAFTTNFRSRPALIDAFNGLFRWLMPGAEEDRPAWEAPFEALTAARDGTGTTELHWLAEDGAAPQAATLAARIPDLLAAHPPHKGLQIAILFRRRTHMGTWAATLRRAGIPHVVARGRGFFSRQEVLDVADLLLSLAHADDGVALLGALRGPFLALEDAWLLWLVRTGGRGPDALRRGWDAVLAGASRPDRLPESWGEVPAEGKAELLRAARAFERWRELRRRLPLSALLRAVLDDTAAAALFARQDPTGQAVANLEKLLSLAVAFDNRGAEGLVEFGRHLREQDALEVDEGEAALDATAPVVLMTIHQSKGLEFPVVVLPDLGGFLSRGATDRVAVGRLHDAHVVALNAQVVDGDRTRRATMIRRLLRRQDRAEQRAESKRLLYVGCTRAREHLLCLAGPTDKERGVDGSVSWREWLRSWRLQDELPDSVAVEEDRETPDLVDASSAAAPPPEEDALTRVLAPLPRERAPQLAPHELAAGDLPQDGGASPAGPAPSDPRALALLRGLLVHRCIEDGLTMPGPATASRVDHALAAHGLLDEAHRRWMTQELAVHLDGYRRAAPEGGMHEVPFQLPLGDGRWLRGEIDLLYRASDRWVVLDYKSNRGDEAALVDHYRPQLLAYAWAASRIVPEIRDGQLPVSAELLFTATGRRVQAFGPLGPPELQEQLEGVLPDPHAASLPHP